MELRHMRYFLAVAEERNFTRAAARVGIGQPPLSQQIRDLEEELGTPLFRRTPQGAELTAAGEAFRVEARAALAQAERARAMAQRAGRGDVGVLRLGFTASGTFHPATSDTIRRFRRRHPDVQLVVEEGNSVALAERLGAQTLDAAFLRPSTRFADLLALHGLAEEPLKVALPAGHRLATRRSVALRDLAQESFVLFNQHVGLGFLDAILAACRAAGFTPVVGQETTQIASMVHLVSADCGVALVPESIAQIRVRGVVYRPLDAPRPTVALALATRRDEDSPVVRNFVGLLPAPRRAAA